MRVSGQPTFTAIREAFNAGRLKCSVDFVSEEYDRLTEGQVVQKFEGSPGTLGFRREDEGDLVKFVCATLNSGRGVVQLDLTLSSHQELSHFYPEPLMEQVSECLKAGLDPGSVPLLNRALTFSANRVRILIKPVALGRIYTNAGIVYVLDNGSVRPARATEIETRAAEVIESRFGERFHKTLSRVSEDSILLSKMPEGIPLYLRSREHLSFFSVERLGVIKIESAAARGREISEDARQLYSEKTKESPFGLPKGNTSFLHRLDIRFAEHYTRYFCFTADVPNDVAQRLSSIRIDKPSIVVASGGAALVCDAGYVIADAPAVLIELPSELRKNSDACLGWFKSSFFLWYLAVHLSQKDLYQQLQKPDIRLPFPDLSKEDFYRRLGALVRNVVLEERRFLDDVQKQVTRGMDGRQREKLRTRHNNTLNGICLTIDTEVNKALGFRPEEIEFISRSITDMGLTDFGMLEQIENERQMDDDSEDGE